jgi:cytochrome c-type biogenesis protein
VAVERQGEPCHCDRCPVRGGLAGNVLLAIYSLGLGIPFSLSAAFAPEDHAPAGANAAGRRGWRDGRMGIAKITGTMSACSFWLLENVPMLARIG